MKRNGTTNTGRTRGYDTAARDVRGFIDWPLSAGTQEQRHVSAHTLQRRNEPGRSLWPPCLMDGQAHDMVHLDGIHLGRKAVVCDGAAASASSSDTRGPTPACNAACSTSAQTSAPYSAGTHATRPPDGCCARPRSSSTRVKDGDAMAAWLGAYTAWETRHKEFHEQKSVWADGSENDLHQRLVKARDTMRRRIREQAMFTFMDPELGTATPVPTTNNAIESVHARIRAMPGNHRGLCLIRRIKAVCRWGHQRTEHPETPAWLATHAWRDEQIERLYRQAWEHSDEGRQQVFDIPARYGTGIDWNEFHTNTPWRNTN